MGADGSYRSRKWFIRLTKENNTKDKGVFTYDFSEIYEELIKKYERVAMCIEIGTATEKEHAHILLQNLNGIRFSALKSIMPYGDIDKQRGSAQDVLQYMSKQVDFVSNVPPSEFEDADRQGARTDLVKIYSAIKEGKNTYEIINENPDYMLKGDSIERFYQLNLSHLYRSTLRLNLKENVTYVYGASGTGKTSGIFEKHGYLNVYRVTDYKHPFDSYNGQKVLVFEEFRNSLKIEDMLNYLDIYPLMLPARYGDKVACYETVYIVSNWSLEQQYETVQKEHKSTYEALMRRITTVRHYTGFKEFKDKPNVTYKQVTLTELKGAELDEIDDIF